MRGLESDIQTAILSTNDAKNNSWNYLDEIGTIRNSLPKDTKADGPVVLELYSRPSSIKDSEQFIKLESRVSTLEKMIGASIHQPYLELGSTNIIATLDRLNAQISFLTDLEFQDQTIKKLENMTVDIDVVKTEKQTQMHHIINSEYLPLVPQILSRLMTLKESHDYSIKMVKRFKELEKVIENDHQIVDDLSKGIKTLEEIMAENSKDIQMNVSKIIDRCKNLERRIEGLYSKNLK